MIYFARVGTDGPIKIGTTDSLGSRLQQHEKTFGNSLFVLGVLDGSFDMERQIHYRFADFRIDIDGPRELFWPDQSIPDFISEHCRKPTSADYRPKLLSIKIDEDVVKLARLVATFEDKQIIDLIGEILRPALLEREKKGVARRYGKPKGGPSR